MIQTSEAKYKGVGFLFVESSTSGGGRLIKYLYPGSDLQSIERQGLMPRSFEMKIIVDSEDYYSSRDNILRVLESDGPGTLVHPTFGEIENVYAGTFTAPEKISELGRLVITVNFEIDNSEAAQDGNDINAATVAAFSQSSIDQAKADLSENFGVSLSFPANFTDAKEQLNLVTDALNNASQVAESTAQKASEFQREVNAISGAVSGLIQAPSSLAESVFNSFESLNNLFETPSELIGAFDLLFDFDSGYEPPNSTTVARKERIDNRYTMQASTQCAALSYLYTASAENEYTNTDDLDERISSLESKYLALRNNPGSSNAMLEQIDRLRTLSQSYFDSVRVNTRRVVTIETDYRPLSVLVYSYYGNTDLVDVIADLNNIKLNAFVFGSVKVLSA